MTEEIELATDWDAETDDATDDCDDRADDCEEDASEARELAALAAASSHEISNGSRKDEEGKHTRLSSYACNKCEKSDDGFVLHTENVFLLYKILFVENDLASRRV